MQLNKFNLISVYPSLSVYGGAEKILIQVHDNIKKYFNREYIMGFGDNKSVNIQYKHLTYLQFKLLWFIKNRQDLLIISHHRKTTTVLKLISWIVNYKIILVHIAHNEFSNFKYLTLFPKNIIAVSERIKQNHVDYFGIKENYIKVIYNGIPDYCKGIKEQKVKKGEKIRILYAARVNRVKNQINLVENLKGKLNNSIIIFAGEGEDLQNLKKIVVNSNEFVVLGHVNNIVSLINDVDYILLFSHKEGLPLSLLEATMCGKPIIANDVGGNTEIVYDDINGYVRNNYVELINVINRLPEPGTETYQKLSEQSRKIYEEKFNLKLMIKNYENYILELVK